MTRVLFVTNGHGEIAIADCIARELSALAPDVGVDHLALVGDVPSAHARDVGPRRRMPSGGLVAMGNVGNIARDLAAGLAALTWAQWRALREARGRYAAVVATGDAYALWMALLAEAPVVYVGTAKSVLVAPYGPGERRLLQRAAAVFVRDEATAEALQRRGIPAQAPGNVIADLFAGGDEDAFAAAVAGFDTVVALLPGSRERAYEDAAFLVDVFARAAGARPGLGSVLSIAPGIDAVRMQDALDAYAPVPLRSPAVPFEVALGGRPAVRAWIGGLGPLLRRSALVLGQAGTANEAAAAAGLPVLAIVSARERGWYRHRQTKLLGDALVMLPPDAGIAARHLEALLDDPAERARRGAVGRERMGPPGGARRIAERIADVALHPVTA